MSLSFQRSECASTLSSHASLMPEISNLTLNHLRIDYRKGHQKSVQLLYLGPPCTVRVDSLPHRKWIETKQQPSMLPGPAVPGCCLVSSHFLWGKLSTRTVQLLFATLTGWYTQDCVVTISSFLPTNLSDFLPCSLPDC